jgi:molybdopterin converting factor small subunit
MEVEVKEERPTVSSVLQIMSQRFGQHIWDYLVAVNGQEIRRLKGLKTEVSSSDTIVIFSPVCGG